MTIIPSVWCVFRKLRRASKRPAEKPSDSGDTCLHSVPGQVHPFSSLYPSGGRSGTGAEVGAGAAFVKTLFWAGAFKEAASRLHADNATSENLLLSTAEVYQYTSLFLYILQHYGSDEITVGNRPLHFLFQDRPAREWLRSASNGPENRLRNGIIRDARPPVLPTASMLSNQGVGYRSRGRLLPNPSWRRETG
jgi:hypothetical protein